MPRCMFEMSIRERSGVECSCRWGENEQFVENDDVDDDDNSENEIEN